MVAGKRKMKRRGLTRAAELCNAATGKIKKEKQYIHLAMGLHSEVEKAVKQK